MFRVSILLFLLAVAAFAANCRLYLKDGTYQIVREYQVNGSRVRYYSVERSEWEEIPLSLVDLTRTDAENKAREERIRKEAEEAAAEEKLERQQREEREKVPQEAGVYLVAGTELKTLRQAEAKVVTNKGRSVLKVMSPLPVVSGKAAVELDGEHSSNAVAVDRPEFYIRLALDERFGIVRMGAKKGARIVQKWSILPVTKELVEQQQDVRIFHRQVDDALYKIWPAQPLEPGEYAVIEWTQGQGNIETWDFTYHPGAAH